MRVFFAVVCCLVCAAASHAKTYGLVVGINAYTHYPPLQGAVNDANDITAALRAMGAARVIQLLDEQATYRAISSSWQELVEMAAPGDTVVFSYAGHGGREPERIPGSEEDQRDESFVLANFIENGPASGERILDNEINQWFRAADKVRIIFVADSCYSGTMMRSIDSRVQTLGHRSIGDYGSPADDQHPPPAVASSMLTPSNLPHVLFFSSSEEDKKTPELLINGQARGALSWAFANAIRGAANVDQDRALTKRELVHYIVANTRMVTEGRQEPTFFPRGHADDDKVLFPAVVLPRERLSEATLQVRIIDQGRADSRLPAQLKGVVAAKEEGVADLVWDRDADQVISGIGDIVTDHCGPGVADFQRVVDKFRLMHLGKQMSERGGLLLRFAGGGKRYAEMEQTTFTLQGRRFNHVTLFALGPDGRAELLYPLRETEPVDPLSLPIMASFSVDLEVSPPFGAEHLVALATKQPLPALHRLLAGGRAGYAELREFMQAIQRKGDVQAGIVGLYSAKKTEQ
ncbi:caspase family protein [Desulfogranum mediterraneum]|uniref:caspase family protein n=1 Tax=Desulfogranum mediterraneum TaxID=160661 RepID=UPI0003FB561A|nr:caspase family protein [Desulfogranum mediterraneum]